MLPRFYLPELDPDHAEALLPADEAHHLARVLRLTVGGEIAVFDGRGCEFQARVAAIDGDRVRVVLLRRLEAGAVPRVALTLVQSILKGEAMDDVVRDCTMVGVDCIQPLISARTTVKLSLLPRAAERWARIALASAKQSGRSRLPRILPAVPLEGWTPGPGQAFVLLEPSAGVEHMTTVRELAHHPAPPAAVLLVGPEGGWTEAERDRIVAAGCRPLTLGPLTLRADAVPLAATAALLAIWAV